MLSVIKMNKNIVLILFILFISSCSKKLIGTYEYTGNCLGWGSEIIHLKENNEFEYISWGDLVGPDTIKGYYKKRINTLTLEPILPYEYKSQMGFVISENTDYNDSTFIQFYSLPPILIKVNSDIYYTQKYNQDLRFDNTSDTLKEYTPFTVNSKFYYTDTTGSITLKLNKNDTISVCNFLTNCEPLYTYTIENDNIGKMLVYYPRRGFNPYFYTDVYNFKKGRIYQDNYRFTTESIVKKTDLYKCIDYKKRRIIRDSVYMLIKKNIDRNLLKDGLYEEFYLTFNKKGRIRKVELGPDEYYCDFVINDKLLSHKIRSNLKKSIKSYKIPYFKKINYNLKFKLVVDYDETIDDLKLDNH
jgi:hypothetical protein